MREPWLDVEPLARALQHLRLRGGFYCQAELRGDWGLRMPSVTDALNFHVVTRGHAHVRLNDGSTSRLETGDVMVVPHGAGHTLTSDPGIRVTPAVEQLPQTYTTPQFSLLQHGEGEPTARLLCGIVTLDSAIGTEFARTLPTQLVVRAGSAAAPFVSDTVRLMSHELATPGLDGAGVTTRLADVLVVQVIRTWLDSATNTTGILAALRDPDIGRAIAELHRDPGKEWTVQRLAAAAHLSKSTFMRRFDRLLGESPAEHVRRWRMLVAQDRLRDEHVPVATLARELGYRSETSFHRAFVAATGRTPGSVRRG